MQAKPIILEFEYKDYLYVSKGVLDQSDQICWKEYFRFCYLIHTQTW